MDLGSLIETHGYWVLAAGCLLEGETVLVLAGLAAYRGYLDPLGVVAVASFMGFASDQFFFWLGRWRGMALLSRWPTVAAKAGRVHALVERYHATVIIGVRFAYGLRIAGPIFIGMSAVPGTRFVALNAIGAVLWACVVGGIGWLSGQAAESVFGSIRHLEVWLFVGLVVVALIVGLVRKLLTK
jgi:membrane protein DedA with SNARE-associated domain